MGLEREERAFVSLSPYLIRIPHLSLPLPCDPPTPPPVRALFIFHNFLCFVRDYPCWRIFEGGLEREDSTHLAERRLFLEEEREEEGAVGVPYNEDCIAESHKTQSNTSFFFFFFSVSNSAPASQRCLHRVVPCSRKKQQNSGFMFPFFSFFWVGVFCPFSGFLSSTLTVVGSFRKNGQVLD